MPITHRWDGTVLTITSDSGTSSADLKGQKGDDGARGPQGQAGSTIAENTQKLDGKEAKYYIQPYNLFDNSYFINPVIQAGFNGKHGSHTYIIDRWRHLYTQYGTATQMTDGIKIAGNEMYMFQKIEETNITGKPLTMAVGLNDGSIICGTAVLNDLTTSIAFIEKNGLCLMYVSSGGFAIRLYQNTEYTIAWAVLYEGSYTAETLPPYVPKGYGAELAECQRYYYQMTATKNANSIVANGVSNGILFYGFINLPTQMAGNQALTLMYENIDIYPMEVGGKIDVADCYLDNTVKSRNVVCIKGTMVGDNILPAKTAGALRINAGGYISLSADL